MNRYSLKYYFWDRSIFQLFFFLSLSTFLNFCLIPSFFLYFILSFVFMSFLPLSPQFLSLVLSFHQHFKLEGDSPLFHYVLSIFFSFFQPFRQEHFRKPIDKVRAVSIKITCFLDWDVWSLSCNCITIPKLLPLGITVA